MFGLAWFFRRIGMLGCIHRHAWKIASQVSISEEPSAYLVYAEIFGVGFQGLCLGGPILSSETSGH